MSIGGFDDGNFLDLPDLDGVIPRVGSRARGSNNVPDSDPYEDCMDTTLPSGGDHPVLGQMGNHDDRPPRFAENIDSGQDAIHVDEMISSLFEPRQEIYNTMEQDVRGEQYEKRTEIELSNDAALIREYRAAADDLKDKRDAYVESRRKFRIVQMKPAF